MKFGIALLASTASAHTLFTTLFINGKNQGDGTCVRLPRDSSTATAPVYPIDGNEMACGRDGNKTVAFTCAAPHKATLTFEFRMHPGSPGKGVIAPGHKGPCSVYVKRVDNMHANSSAAGPGWFKIWEDGYDSTSNKWCVDTLIEKKGLLSVNLPAGLPAGYYLVRPEILALHNAAQGDPQFYLGCAQIYIQQGPNGSLDIPDGYGVSIPGYVSADTPGVKFNIYGKPLPKYPIPGPRVFVPEGGSSVAKVEQSEGAVPDGCILKNANWCAKPVPGFSSQDGCWASVKDCYNQGQACWDTAPPSGDSNCKIWQDYCKKLEGSCESGKVKGPDEFKANENMADLPGGIPQPWNNASKSGKGGSSTTMTTMVKTATATSEAE